MAVRIDLEARTVTCSVHDLLADAYRRSLAPGEGLARLSVGAELHRVIQGRRREEDAHYTPEVAVDTVLEIDGWRLRVIGRADGVSRPPGRRPVVEEIKTLHFRTELHTLFAQDRLERYRSQARIYAACLFPDGCADVRLLLVDLGGSGERVDRVAWSPAEVHAYLRGRLHSLIAAERERERIRARWRAAGERLQFPFPEPRPVQREAMEAIASSLEAGRHLLLAAPTGVGKTVAALYPALRMALATGRRVAFLTAKTLQQKLAVETIQAMQEGGWHSIQIRAKARMCANDEVICHEELCAYARDHGAKMVERGVLPALLEHAPHLDPDRIFAVAKGAEACPFEASLEAKGECTAVVCDYNYVFDPVVGMLGSDQQGLEDTYLIVDEAHNLLERAREYYSPRLETAALAEARALVGRFRQKVCRDLDEVLEGLERLLGRTVMEAVGPSAGVRRSELPLAELATARLALDGLIAPYFVFKRNVDLWLARDPVIDALLSLARLVELLEEGGRELVPLVERRADGGEAVRVYCVDPARYLGRILDACAGCVAMSATLEPFEFYRDLLGFDPERTDMLALPSPFPPENRLIVAVDEVDTSYRERTRHYGRIAELVAELAPPDRNALVLFPSYAFLREVADRLVVTGHRVEIQRGDDGDHARREVLRLLRDNAEPVLLLGVLGGVFAEGVDYPGEMLSAVIVVSPALPQVGPERELLKTYFEDRFERGFEYAYLVPGMTRVVQAAGRLIRSATDRGAIVLVCRRFLREPYAGLLPLDWAGGMPATLRRADPAAAVREFFMEDKDVERSGSRVRERR